MSFHCGDYVDRIYLTDLEIKDTTKTERSAITIIPECVISSHDLKGDESSCHHLASTCLSTIYNLIFSSETNGTILTNFYRDVQWMVRCKNYVFLSNLKLTLPPGLQFIGFNT